MLLIRILLAITLLAAVTPAFAEGDAGGAVAGGHGHQTSDADGGGP